MQFETPLIKGTLIKRYKRFLADVQLENGDVVVAHCPNTGAMTGCAEPNFIVWLSESNNPKRKLAFTWEIAKNFDNQWIGINTHRANKLVVEGIENQTITELDDYQALKTEVKYGEENSRIDILLTGEGKPNCYVEVKSVTLLDNKQGLFPDAKTQRGVKHLRELTTLVTNGYRAVLCYCVQHTGIQSVSVAKDIDPEYTEALEHAIAKGVEVIVYGCKFTEEKIVLNQRLKFI